MEESYYSLEVPDRDLLLAIAEETSLSDSDVDGLERRLLEEKLEEEVRLALALTIARAGRPQSGGVISELSQRLSARGQGEGVRVLGLARELLASRPGPRVERAESGYRYTDPAGHRVLYVEDPVAAHWHRRGRWGPPLRPDPTCAPLLLFEPGQVEAGVLAAKAGEVLMVVFRPRAFGAPEAPLRLTAAGLARDPDLTLRWRWSEVRSVGFATTRRRRSVAFEVRGEPLVILPPRPSIPAEDLHALITALVARGRSRA